MAQKIIGLNIQINILKQKVEWVLQKYLFIKFIIDKQQINLFK